MMVKRRSKIDARKSITMERRSKIDARKSMVTERWSKIFRAMIYILPGVLFFSYYPLIHFGSDESMNFEISLPLVWLVLFDMLVLTMGARRREFWWGIWERWLWLLFPIFLTISAFWSLNPLRGVLTVGILWLVYFAIYGFWSFRRLFSGVEFWEKFWRVFFGSTLVVCVWCGVQCVLDIAGVPREYSLMCAGCTYSMFGFSHPNGFAIEPQFMGNLLLAPTIMMAYFFIKDDYNSVLRGRGSSLPSSRGSDPSYLGRNLRKSLRALLLAVFLIGLFLTFSRGAIYAFVVAMVIMTVWMLVGMRKKKEVRQKIKRVLWMWGVIVLGFLFTLNLQGVMAEVSPTNDTYRSGVAKALNHLSLGVVDVREKAADGAGDAAQGAAGEAGIETAGGAIVDEGAGEVAGGAVGGEAARGNEAMFDGYVAESTDTRLRLSGAAVRIWSADFMTAMFGVGLGGAGQALYVSGLSPAPKEIVQNQYASLLLETGAVGVLLFGFSLMLVVRVFWRSPLRIALISLTVAYGVSLLFFSGLPNALHVYLLLGVMATKESGSSV